MDVTSYLLGKQQGGGGTPNLQNKDVTITENGNTNVSADAGYDGLGNVGITTSVQPSLETLQETITTNGTTTYTPSQDKDGFSSVEITTNVSSGDTPKITGGTTTVPGYFNTLGQLSFEVTGTDASYMFSGYPAPILPSLSTLEDIITADYMFRYASGPIKIDISTLGSKQRLTSARGLFNNCSKVAIIDVSGLEFTKISNSTGKWEIFSNCGISCLQSDGAYADGIPYIYVKNATEQNWVLTNSMNDHPSSWSTNNVLVKQ